MLVLLRSTHRHDIKDGDFIFCKCQLLRGGPPDADSEDGKGPKNEVPAASYSPRPSFVSILADILCDFI